MLKCFNEAILEAVAQRATCSPPLRITLEIDTPDSDEWIRKRLQEMQLTGEPLIRWHVRRKGEGLAKEAVLLTLYRLDLEALATAHTEGQAAFDACVTRLLERGKR